MRTTQIREYTKLELTQAVHFERAELVKELGGHTRRIREIEARLDELEKADALLDGME